MYVFLWDSSQSTFGGKKGAHYLVTSTITAPKRHSEMICFKYNGFRVKVEFRFKLTAACTAADLRLSITPS